MWRWVLVFAWCTACGSVDSFHDGGADAGGDDAGSDAGLCRSTDTWADYGQAFFTTTCADCHDNDHTAMTDHGFLQRQITRITGRISAGNMPVGRTLSASERGRLLDYLACGAP